MFLNIKAEYERLVADYWRDYRNAPTRAGWNPILRKPIMSKRQIQTAFAQNLGTLLSLADANTEVHELIKSKLTEIADEGNPAATAQEILEKVD